MVMALGGRVGHGEGEPEADLVQAPVLGLSQPRHPLRQPNASFDALAEALAHGVARMTRRAGVDHRVLRALRYMHDLGHELRGPWAHSVFGGSAPGGLC
jgi:hypothetical protein